MPILYVLDWTFKILMAVPNFIVWEIISDGRWKEYNRPPYNVARVRLEEAIEAKRQLRELQYTSRRQLEEAQNKFREELNRKEREISYLRSLIH